MASRIQNSFLKASSRLFGKPREARQPGTPLQVTPETSIWEIYNHEAENIDREKIKDWNDSLNTLLIFAALYSAVLTAFIVESMKLIQEDNSKTARDILLVISQQLANNSTPAFQPTTFTAPDWAVRVNYEFFISISCSLITALAAVLALQWVGSYDRGLNQSSPEDKALQRQYRDEGVERWKMDQIIGFLPAIIFFALLVFFIGLADWLWHIHHGVAAIVIVGVIIGVLFFWTTTLISMIDVRAPFRTPTSRGLPAYLGIIYQSALVPLRILSRQRFIRTFRNMKARIRTYKTKVVHWYQKGHRLPASTSIGQLLRRVASLKSLPERSTSNISGVLKHLLVPLICQDPFPMREQGAINSAETIKRDSLLWLARSISVVPHQKNSFILLIQSLLQIPPEQLIDERVNSAPWKAIFTSICHPLFNKSTRNAYSEEDLVFLLHGLAFIGRGQCDTPDFEQLFKTYYTGEAGPKRMCANLAFWKIMGEQGAVYDNSLYESYRYSIEYAQKWPLETVVATLICVRVDARRFHFNLRRLLPPLLEEIPVDINPLSVAPVLTLQMIDIILDIAVASISRKSLPNADTISAYLTHFQPKNVRPFLEDARQFHSTILQHLCAALRHLNDSSGKGVNSEAHQLLSRLVQLVGSPLWEDVASRVRIHLLLALANTEVDIWDGKMKHQTTKLLALAMPNRSNDGDEDRDIWWVNLLLGYEDILTANEIDAQFIYIAILYNSRRALRDHPPNPDRITSSQIERLQAIRDPFVLLIASRVLRSPELGFAALPLDINLGRDRVWQEIVQWYNGDLGEIFLNPNVQFLRELLLLGTPEFVAGKMERPDIESAQEFLQGPILYKMLQSRDPRAIINVLKSARIYDWFIKEFMVINGPQLLPGCLYWAVIYLEEAIELVQAMVLKSTSYGDIYSWITCLRSCLVCTGLSLQGRNTATNDKLEMLEIAEDAVQKLITSIHALVRRWNAQRENGPSSTAKALQMQSEPSGEIQVSSHPDDDSSPIDGCNAKDWTLLEWEDLQSLIEEVIPGLRRGYILEGAPAVRYHYGRDPDGMHSTFRM